MKQNSLIHYFKTMPDPRINRTEQHDLEAILTISICAVICGTDGWVSVEEFDNSNIAWFKKFLRLENGIPSHDTFGRVFSMLDPKIFGERFIQSVKYLAEPVVGDVIAIDGKTLRRSFDQSSEKSAIHIVSAWSSANSLVLGQVKTEQKSNEITAIPKLLELLSLESLIVTIDAMGCQKAIVKMIIEKEADYIIALKGNQGTLHEEVIKYFAHAESESYEGITYDCHEEVSGDHGRIETRKVTIVKDIDWFEDKDIWSGLSSIIKVESTREIGDKISTENRYYISSLDSLSAQQISDSIRKHWGVENNLHWSLDVSFSEDDCRIREGHADENFSTLRRTALNLLRKEKTLKVGIANKRLKAGWDERYLVAVAKLKNCFHCETTRGRSNPNIKEL